MDKFDEIYDNQYRNRKPMSFEEENKEGKKEILKEKNDVLFKFFSSKKTLIFLWVLVISFAYSLYQTLSDWFTGANTGLFDYINDIALLAFAILLPISVKNIYQGAKTHFRTDVVLGLNIARTYMLILRVLLIIASVALGILFLFSMGLMTGWLFLLMLCLIGIIVAQFYMVAIFKEFIETLRGAVQKFNVLIPPANRVIKFLIVMLVLLVIVYAGLFIGVEYFINNLNIIFEEVEFTASMIAQLQAELNSLFIYVVISVVLALGSQAYMIYYFKSYNQEVLSYNVTLRKRVDEHKEYMYKEKTEENDHIKMNWGD